MSSPHPIRSNPFDATAFSASGALGKLRAASLVAGIAGLALSLFAYTVSPDYFFRAWLVGWVFWVSIALGCLGFIMLQHLTAGGWGLAVRRVLEAAAWTFPILGVLGIPILFGMPSLYSWADPARAAGDPILALKAPYLNPDAFLWRYVLYFAIWTALAWSLGRLSRRQDDNGDPNLTVRMKAISAPGLILLCLTLTFAAVDWLMSLMPHWYSTMYGIYFIGCSGVAGLCFTILVARRLSRTEPMAPVLVRRHFHDYGKLLLAFIMLWAYFCFSQFLITWSGNLPEEIQWFHPRMHGFFGAMAVFIALFHFAVPFAALLSASLKKQSARLSLVAIWLLFMRWIDLIWQVDPSVAGSAYVLQNYWMFLVTPVAVGGIWMYAFTARLASAPLLAVRDPYADNLRELMEAPAHE